MKFKMLLAALLALGVLAAPPVQAAEVDSGDVYCFGAGDFSQEELLGICVTGLPEETVGTVLLGQRIIRPGDILPGNQLDRLTFVPNRRETDIQAQILYLPVFSQGVGQEAALTLSIRGRENQAPITEDFAAETYKNLPLEGKLKVREPENETMTFAVVRNPKRGQVEIKEDGSFTYTPKKNKVGIDSFVYTATDAAGKVSREATVTITIVKPTDSAQYTDTVGLSCRFAAEWMKNTGIFVGETLDGNPCFQPEKEVTRGEFLTMLVRTLDLPLEKEQTLGTWQEDTPSWLRPYLASAVRSGLMAGLPEGERFDHEAPITGAEAAVMIQNALALTADTEAAALEPAPDWAYPAMAALNAWGIPLEDAPLTRSQTANALYQVSKLVREAPGMVILNNRR
jgi:hypothetical protein